MRGLLLVALVALACAAVASGQNSSSTAAAPVAKQADQSYVLDAPPKVLDPSEFSNVKAKNKPFDFNASPVGLDVIAVRTLICKALKAQGVSDGLQCSSTEPGKSDAEKPNPGKKEKAPKVGKKERPPTGGDQNKSSEQECSGESTYYILHLVQHVDGKVGTIRDAWYTYFRAWGGTPTWLDKLNDPEFSRHYKQARLFGARCLSLLYIHYNVPGATWEAVKSAIPHGSTLKRGTEEEVQTWRDRVMPKVQGSNGARLAGLGDQSVEESFLPITYTIDVTKKTPVVVDNLKAVLGQFGLFGAEVVVKVKLSPKALTSAKLDMKINYPTSDIAIAGQRGEDRKNIGSQVFDNERKYWVDFGFAIPVSKIKELKFSDNFAAQPQETDKANIYGMVSIFPLGPVDTKASRVWFQAPQLMYGMALNDKPWNNHLFALGFLTKYVQPFVGMTLTDKQVRAPTTSDTGLKWSTHLAYGLHVPASSIATFIKKSAGK